MHSGSPTPDTLAAINAHHDALMAAVEQCGVSYLWLIGARARGDDEPGADWDFMFAAWDYDTRQHERLEAKLSTIFGVAASCLLVSHVVREFTTEQAECVVKQAVQIVRAGRRITSTA
jgi:predicted nucleotidyltransferase